jgi:hypothetical protein
MGELELRVPKRVVDRQVNTLRGGFKTCPRGEEKEYTISRTQTPFLTSGLESRDSRGFSPQRITPTYKHHITSQQSRGE